MLIAVALHRTTREINIICKVHFAMIYGHASIVIWWRLVWLLRAIKITAMITKPSIRCFINLMNLSIFTLKNCARISIHIWRYFSQHQDILSTGLILPRILPWTTNILLGIFGWIIVSHYLVSMVVHIHLVTSLDIYWISNSPLVFLLLAISMILLALLWLIFQEKLTAIDVV